MALGTTEFVAGHSEARVILRTSDSAAGVRREGGLMGTVSSGCEVCLTPTQTHLLHAQSHLYS